MSLTIEGNCKICNVPIDVQIAVNGGLPLVDAHGFSGMTDDGDTFTCRDHYCTVCGDCHRSTDEFDRCAFYGGLHRAPSCVDAAVLG